MSIEPTANFELITPALASSWLEPNDLNRKLDPSHMGQIVKDLSLDRFLITGESIKFDNDGKLIDGQHRLRAIVKSDKEATVLVVRGLEPGVILVIDSHKKRTFTNHLEMKRERNAGILTAAIRVHLYYLHGLHGIKSFSASEKDQHFSNHPGLRDWLTIGSRVHSGIGTPSGAVAAMLYVFESNGYSLDVIYEFASSLAAGVDLKASDAVYLLRAKLPKSQGTGLSDAIKLKTIVSFMIEGFNAWASDRKPRLQVLSEGFPKVLAPWESRFKDEPWVSELARP